MHMLDVSIDIHINTKSVILVKSDFSDDNCYFIFHNLASIVYHSFNDHTMPMWKVKQV